MCGGLGWAGLGAAVDAPSVMENVAPAASLEQCGGSLAAARGARCLITLR